MSHQFQLFYTPRQLNGSLRADGSDLRRQSPKAFVSSNQTGGEKAHNHALGIRASFPETKGETLSIRYGQVPRSHLRPLDALGMRLPSLFPTTKEKDVWAASLAPFWSKREPCDIRMFLPKIMPSQRYQARAQRNLHNFQRKAPSGKECSRLFALSLGLTNCLVS